METFGQLQHLGELLQLEPLVAKSESAIGLKQLMLASSRAPLSQTEKQSSSEPVSSTPKIHRSGKFRPLAITTLVGFHHKVIRLQKERPPDSKMGEKMWTLPSISLQLKDSICWYFPRRTSSKHYGGAQNPFRSTSLLNDSSKRFHRAMKKGLNFLFAMDSLTWLMRLLVEHGFCNVSQPVRR